MVLAPLDRLAPAARIASAALLSVAMALLATLTVAGVALGLGALLLCCARLETKKTLRRLGAANLFVAFLWIFLPFTTPGRPAFTLGAFVVTVEGLRIAALITIKSNAMLFTFTSLVAAMDVAALGQGLQTLRAPERLCQIFLFAIRYVHVIEAEYRRLITAARIRCFCPRNDLHTYRTYAHLVGMLLVRSLERAERVYQAMLCRGFEGRFYSLAERALRPADRFAALIASVAAVGLLIWDKFA